MITRRTLLSTLVAAPAFAAAPAKPMRGIFPIMQTPFTDANKLDTAALVKEALFLDRCGVHGMVWPQLASEYFTLTKPERIEGAEALLSVAKQVRAAVVIGVQAPDAAQAIEYARHATRLGADGIIALPPRGMENDEAVGPYYKAIGESSPLPLFVQAIGQMTSGLIIRLSREIPTLKYVKDEAGSVLEKISEYRRKAPEIRAFTGGHGKTMYEEMVRGSAGNMPAASFADLYSAAWDLYQADQRREATELWARSLALLSAVDVYGLEALKYMLYLRGVFGNTRLRAERKGPPLDAEAKRAIAELLENVKPWLRT